MPPTPTRKHSTIITGMGVKRYTPSSTDMTMYTSNGTNGDEHPTLLPSVTITLTYDGHTLIIYRDGFVDQVIEVKGLELH